MEKVCQKNLLNFRTQVAYFQQNHEMSGKPITEAERMKAQTQRRKQNPHSKATKTFNDLK